MIRESTFFNTSKIFFMRTTNKHPQWYNQPLRLNAEEKQNPVLIFDDFFECYHLNEVREILWNWMVEVLSSTHGISIDAHDRSNHIYFYEKIEVLVESAFIIHKRFHKKMNKRKRKG